MWIELNMQATNAIDANMKAVEALNAARGSVEGIPFLGSKLVANELRYLINKANDLDTKLRGFLLSIHEEAKQEGELAR